MDKEQVTEELVRQNGNQAAAVMADYVGQEGGDGGGGSSSDKGKVVYGGLVDLFDLPCFKPISEWPQPSVPGEETVKLSDVLADGYALVHWMFEDSMIIEGGFFIVKVTGNNPSVQLIDGNEAFTDCEAVTLDLPSWVVERFAYIQAIGTLVLDDISKDDPMISAAILPNAELPEFGNLGDFIDAPLLIGEVLVGTDFRVCICTHVNKSKSPQ